jgi:hypothetical protein
MPTGERSQVWYPSVVALLRAGWHSGITLPEIIALRRVLQTELTDYRSRRGILPPTIHCWSCGAIGPASPPSISVRAVLFALRRFGIESDDRVREREREWKRYRAAHGLDQYGQAAGTSETAAAESPLGCPDHE